MFSVRPLVDSTLLVQSALWIQVFPSLDQKYCFLSTVGWNLGCETTDTKGWLYSFRGIKSYTWIVLYTDFWLHGAVVGGWGIGALSLCIVQGQLYFASFPRIAIKMCSDVGHPQQSRNLKSMCWLFQVCSQCEHCLK